MLKNSREIKNPKSFWIWSMLIGVFFLPHIQFPGSYQGYSIKPSDIPIIIGLFGATFQNKINLKWFDILAFNIVLFWSFSLIWGWRLLENDGMDVFRSKFGETYYLTAALKKFLSYLICFWIFRTIWVQVKIISSDRIVIVWLFGLMFAVLVNLGMIILDVDPLLTRGGVLKEGNFSASFFVLSLILSNKIINSFPWVHRLSVLFAIIGLVIAKSAMSLVLGFSVVLILLVKSSQSRIKWRGSRLIIVVGLTIISILGWQSELYEKIFPSQTLNGNNFSYYDRSSLASSAVSLFRDHPILGAGLQSFGFWYTSYIDEFYFNIYDFESIRIVNNIYLQILAEHGIVGSVTFWSLFVYLIAYSIKKFGGSSYGFIALVVLLVSWVAFPSPTVTFQWFAVGLCFKISEEEKIKNIK